MAFSRALKDSILNWYRGTAFPAAPATVYVELLTTMPTDDTGAGLVAVSTAVWSNYARQATGTMSAPSGSGGTRSISNNALIDYGVGTLSGNVTIVGVAFYDAPTAGTYLGSQSFAGSQTVTNGTDVQFAIGALQLNES